LSNSLYHTEQFRIDKIVRTRNKKGIKNNLEIRQDTTTNATDIKEM